MKNKYCVLISSYGRPDKVITLKTLGRFGFTGEWFLVCDDKDKTLPQYIKNFGEDKVLIFSKDDIANRYDEGDNFGDRRSAFYARCANVEIARKLGYKYFLQLDDDYDSFRWRISPEIEYSSKMLSSDPDYRTLDKVFDAMFDYFVATPQLTTLCMSQSGDFIGGKDSKMMTDQYRRKAMNSFFCDVDRPFIFQGKMNEDVNAYITASHRGSVTLTTAYISLNQKTTQLNPGGVSDLYVEVGTYMKTFYSVMVHPSGTKVSVLFNTSARKKNAEKSNNQFRVHHRIAWNNTAPKILKENIKKSLT
jgi:hypothetical protein